MLLWGGCAALPPNSFFDPTKVGQFTAASTGYQENDIKRVLTARDTTAGPQNATEPTPSDLEVRNEEYRLGRGDVVVVQIPDLIAAGQVYEAQLEINNAGEVRLPQLGTIKAVGLSETEFEEAVRKRLSDEAILPNPILQVQTANRRNRVYSIMGSVAAAGPYPIPQPDFRLLDAIAFARDIGPEVRKLYVIRRVEDTPLSPAMSDRFRETGDGDVFMIGGEEDDQAGTFSSGDGPRSESPRRRATSADDDLDALLAQADDAVPDDGGFQGLKIERDAELRDRRNGRDDGRVPGVPGAEPFDWDDVPELASSQRIIEIDVTALKNGDPRYNIVVRDRDVIQVPVDTGVFYMMGEIARPGVYAFGGREITVKQAIALSGGFTPLAWPARCEIIRREQGTDKQLTIPINLDAVFAGSQPDVLMRTDDVFNAGTDVAAPFLFVLRNSFRFTYGYGFVYDRNFADQDAYFPRNNPQSLRESQRATSGLPF